MQITVCDGCGCSDGEMVSVGKVLPKDYCPCCAEKAQAYLDSVDEAHRDAIAKFNDALCHAKDCCDLKAIPDA